MLIALSGHARAVDIAKATEAGYDHHIAKPADLPLLLKLVDNFCAASADFDEAAKKAA
jgi:CheY-like chemotaxis protein